MMKSLPAAAVAALILSVGGAWAVEYNTPFPPLATLGGETRLIYPDTPVELLVTEEESGGQFGMVVAYGKPGEGPADNMMLEPKLTETFYVLAGTFKFTQGDKTFEGGPGTVVVNPPTLPHGFQVVGDEVGKLLIITTPSDGPRKGADFFVEWAAQSSRSPEWIAKTNAAYGIDRQAP